MSDRPLDRRARIVIAVCGVVTAILAVVATALIVGADPRTVRAHAQVAVVPTAERSPGQALTFWNSLIDPQEVRIVRTLIGLPETHAAADQAAGLPAGSTRIAVSVPEKTNLIDVTVDAPTEDQATRALETILDSATTRFGRVAGLVTVQITQPVTVNAADDTGIFVPIVTIVALGGLLAGAFLAHVVLAARPGRRAQPSAVVPPAGDWQRRGPPLP